MNLGRITALIIALSVALVGWIGYEIGLWGFTTVSAAEQGPQAEASPAPPAEANGKGEPARPTADKDLGVDGLHRALELRAKELEAKELEIRRREREVADKEAVLAQQMDRYEKIIQELKGQVGQLESLNRSKVEGFRKLFEKMDPKKAARILETTQMALAAEILGEMRPQMAAEVMGKMSHEKAAVLTEKYLSKRLPALERKNSSRTGGAEPGSDR